MNTPTARAVLSPDQHPWNLALAFVGAVLSPNQQKPTTFLPSESSFGVTSTNMNQFNTPIYNLGRSVAKRASQWTSANNLDANQHPHTNQIGCFAHTHRHVLLSDIWFTKDFGAQDDTYGYVSDAPHEVGSFFMEEDENGKLRKVGPVAGPHTKKMASIEPSLKQRLIENEMCINANLMCAADMEAFLEDFYPTEGTLAILRCLLGENSSALPIVEELWQVHHPPLSTTSKSKRPASFGSTQTQKKRKHT